MTTHRAIEAFVLRDCIGSRVFFLVDEQILVLLPHFWG